MSSSLSAARRTMAALTVLATAILLLIGLNPGQAAAVETTKGPIVFSMTSGKAGKVSAISPASVVKRFGKKGAKVSTAAKNGSFGEKVASGLQAAGGLRLANGKRSVALTGLKLTIDRKLAVVRGNVAGKKNIVVFTAAGKGTLSADPGSVKFTGGKLRFPASVANLVRNRLKLKTAPTGPIGTLFVNAFLDTTVPVDPCELDPDAEGCPVIDPYLTECNVAATSKATGSLPAAAPLPTLTNPQAITGLTRVGWGIKSSFRNYMVSPAAAGSIHARDGATATGSAPAYSGFDWTFVDGQYADNGTPNDPSDDQAILNLSGTVVLCATGHSFRVAISDPTIVVDGANSRIIADVDSNLTGVWTPAQRIDVATLNLAGGTTSLLSGTLGTKWENVPAAMTENGGKAICGVTEPQCPYSTGTAMDPVTVEARAGI